MKLIDVLKRAASTLERIDWWLVERHLSGLMSDEKEVVDELSIVITELEEAEPVYAYRRKGQDDFCTCGEERYNELAQKPNLFEVTKLYTHPKLDEPHLYFATHRKTGNTYKVIGDTLNCTNAQDGQVMVLYEREGKTFVRELSEFLDKFVSAHVKE